MPSVSISIPSPSLQKHLLFHEDYHSVNRCGPQRSQFHGNDYKSIKDNTAVCTRRGGIRSSHSYNNLITAPKTTVRSTTEARSSRTTSVV